jgi:hypothetical protein
MIRAIRATSAGLALAMSIASCGEPTRPREGDTSVTPSPDPFDAAVQCRQGEEDGAQYWEYGADPRGTIDDPVTWVREETIGLDPTLTLSFLEEFRGHTDVLENVVLAKDELGSVVAFVEFGNDDQGRYFPNYAEACARAPASRSSGSATTSCGLPRGHAGTRRSPSARGAAASPRSGRTSSRTRRGRPSSTAGRSRSGRPRPAGRAR